MNESKNSFKHSGIGKSLKWLFLVLFIFFLSLTLFFYNVVTIVNQKKIKQMGAKFVSGILESNRTQIDPNITEMIEYSKANPGIDFQMPTAIKDININVKTDEIAKLNKETFYQEFPVIASESIYNTTLNSIVNDNLKLNKKMPFLEERLMPNNPSRGSNNGFYYLVAITILNCILYFFLNDPKKFVFNIGIIVSLITFPIYLTFYILNPFVTSIIRKLDFVVANMVTDSLSKFQFNYLKFFIAGIVLILIGLLIQYDFKPFFRKKSKYEKVIKA